MAEERPLVWVVDDDRSIRWVLTKALERAGYQVTCFQNVAGVVSALEETEPDVLLTDIRMPGRDGLALLGDLQHERPQLPVIVMTAHSDMDAAVAAYGGGAFEYLPKPFDVNDAVQLVGRALESLRPSELDTPQELDVPDLIGEAPAMQEVFRAVGRLSRSGVTVLISGESGTGKELVGQALHRHSPRAGGPFIALNMAAIPRDLMESELFGHERGAFTGAHQARQGRFEQADGGTLFLDEIGDMPHDLQTRLLRVLADGEFYRVGAHSPTRVDVRIIAATHQDLERQVSEGRFREDLFHRLNVIRVHLPPLRERREDIPTLARHFLACAARELNVEPKALRQEVERRLAAQPWPGNVRQLENVCRWLTVMASGQEVLTADLPPELQRESPDGGRGEAVAGGDWRLALARWAQAALASGEERLMERAQPIVERTMIEAALAASGGRRHEAARLLGWGRNTLTRKIQALGMDEGRQSGGAPGTG